MATSFSDRVVCGELYAQINKAGMGVRSVVDVLFVKLLTALGFCVGGFSIFAVCQQFL